MENQTQNLQEPQTLTLYGTLGPDAVSGHELARRIWALEREGCPEVHLRINSSGGSVSHGYSLFSALHHTKMRVHTHLDGLALSMAGLIYLAGQVRHMAPWGLLMLHNPGLPESAEPEPDGEDAEAVRSALKGVRESLVGMYEETTELPKGKLEDMMDAETWLTATECTALGLAHDLGGRKPRYEFEGRVHEKLAKTRAWSQALAQSHRHDREAVLEAVAQWAEAEQAGERGVAPESATQPMPVALKTLLTVQAQSVDPKAGWSFRDFEKKDPAALRQMMVADAGRFTRLYSAQYK